MDCTNLVHLSYDLEYYSINDKFTNELQHNMICGIYFNDISDHLPICEYQIKRNAKKDAQHIRVINQDTLVSFSCELSLQSWDNILDTAV